MQLIRPLCEAVSKLAEIIDGLSERIEKLEKVVLDDIIGGVTNLYNKNKSLKDMEELRGRYGSELGEDDMEIFKNFYGDRDPIADMYEMVKDKMGTEGFDPDSELRPILDSLKQKIAKAKPKAVEVEMETAVEPDTSQEVETSPEDELKAKIAKMKAQRPKGLSY